MATIKCNGMDLEEVTEPQIFDPPQEMLVIDEADDTPIKKKVAAILATGYNHNVVATDETFWQSCFRIPEKPAPCRATNRELAKWLAQGNGEWHGYGTPPVTEIGFGYEVGKDGDILDDAVKVRKWEDTEWHEPDVEYMGIQD